jgi:glycosyltransferase involved in cell wall biosynthesis
MRLAKQANVAIALSTVYWDCEELEAVYAGISPIKFWLKRRLISRPGRAALRLAEKLLGRESLLPKQSHERVRVQASIARSADVLLPNSYTEMERVRKDLDIEADFIVVPNAVEPDFGSWPGEVSREIEELGPYVLCVGNLQIRKNQLLLARAVQDLHIPLVLVGGSTGRSRAERRYVGKIMEQQGRGVHVLGPVEHGQLPPLYRRARVHALASWYETPGLSSLEAALCGCAIVSTDRGSAREYFLDHAHYCSPDSLPSVRSAVESAWNRGSDPILADLVKERFTWTAAAAATIAGYELALKKRKARVPEAG